MRAVVGLVQPCNNIADIGCDHGYVAIELVEGGICSHVIAMDINKGPLERAMANIKAEGLEGKIETRLSNGTKALKPNEADGIICAGMGGKLIISILEEGRELVANMKQLILQPQSEIDEVRYYLRSNGYVTTGEDMVLEDGKYYPMMSVKKSDFLKNNICDDEKSDIKRIFDKYGQGLLEMSHPVLKQYLLWQKNQFTEIRANLLIQENKNQRQLDRINELDIQINDIEFCLKNYYQ
jgi:tRNA (adenine22-N1)-methyltransferase